MAGYAFFIEYGFNLGVKVNRSLARTEHKKDNDRDDGDKDKNYLLGKEIHQQLLGVKVTIIQILMTKESSANVSVKKVSSLKSHLLITFAFQKKLL
jgi:hypothetical protein